MSLGFTILGILGYFLIFFFMARLESGAYTKCKMPLLMVHVEGQTCTGVGIL